MNKVKVGVIGVGRGRSMMNYCQNASNAELVAICDKYEAGLARAKADYGDAVACYADYDEFLKHDMDVVILANYANEHAPFAIKAMNAGHHVISEVLPCQCMKEAVELIETVEKTGKLYIYAENYCFIPAVMEMRRLYQDNLLGEIDYAEGEYVHNCEPSWHGLTYGDPKHWRNNGYPTFYCTHSLGPLVHITGVRPAKVVGIELPYTAACARMGRRFPLGSVIMTTLENGAVVKSIHGDLQRNNVSYILYGTKGRAETGREAAGTGCEKLYVDYCKTEGNYSDTVKEEYNPLDKLSEEARNSGHGGADFVCMWNAMEKILGNEEAETMDVYEALDMFLPGIFAYKSILAGGITLDIPNLRDPAEREKWRNDTSCTDPKVAGDMLWPSCSKPIPEIPDAVYEAQRRKWEGSQS